MFAPGFGDLEPAGSLGLGRVDQALVLELRERRVNRPRAWAPASLAALLDRLHQLVAVPRLLGEQAQQRQADIASAGAAASVAMVAPTGTAERAALPHTPQRDQVLDVLERWPAA